MAEIPNGSNKAKLPHIRHLHFFFNHNLCSNGVMRKLSSLLNEGLGRVFHQGFEESRIPGAKFDEDVVIAAKRGHVRRTTSKFCAKFGLPMTSALSLFCGRIFDKNFDHREAFRG
jgi:hypothetical protein